MSDHPQLVKWANGIVHMVRQCSICGSLGPFLIAEQSYCRDCARDMLKEVAWILQTSTSDNSAPPPAATLERSIDELELSVRTYNCLKNANVTTVNDLMGNDEHELLKIKGLGLKSLKELKNVLGGMGLKLKL